MQPSPESAPSVAEAEAIFDKMLRQLHVAEKGLAKGPDREELHGIINALQDAVRSFRPALEQSEAEIQAMRQQAQELLKSAMTEAPALPAPEEAAVLGPRLRQEVLQRYGTKAAAPRKEPVRPEPAGDLGSVASEWESVSTSSESPPTPPAAPPRAPAAPQKPAKPAPRKAKQNGDAWDDLSRAEE